MSNNLKKAFFLLVLQNKNWVMKVYKLIDFQNDKNNHFTINANELRHNI